MTPARQCPADAASGFTLLEFLFALIVFTIGVLSVAQLFPAGARGQTEDRLQASASFYAQEKSEWLAALPATDAQLAPGQHPASGYEACGPGGRWQRTYLVTAMDPPLADLKKIVVSVTWPGAKGRSVMATTYVKP